jgi:DNA topoisomerase-1
MNAIRTAADELGNTPAVCRKSYVHATVVHAFEDGALKRFAASLHKSHSSFRRSEALAKIVASKPPARGRSAA